MTYNKPSPANDTPSKTAADAKSPDASRKDAPTSEKPAVVTVPGKNTQQITPPPKA